MSEIDVPQIDLAGWHAGTDRDSVVAKVRDAALRCGFFVIVNHGVEHDVINAAWTKVHDFFDLPTEEKMKVAMRDPNPYGYSGMMQELTGGELKGEYGAADLKETYQVALGPAVGKHPAMPETNWPSKPEGFSEAYTAYYRAMEKLATELLHILAIGLKLEPGFFDAKQKQHWSALRCLNYPHTSTPPAPGQLRAAAHTDYGTITLLRADNAPGGLQVQMKDGSWRDVPFTSDCYVVNLGDLMQRWTNDQYKSTMHRVVPPPADAEGSTRRQSMAFFHNLDRDAVCETIPSCIDEAHPAKYPPINAFDHLMERHAKSVGQKKFEVKE